MNKAIIFILLLAGAIFAQTELEKNFNQQTSQAGLPEYFSNWRVLSMIAIFTSIILVGIAYMIGRGMEMPEIQSWASTELVQVFVNVIIVIALLATIALIDVVVTGMVQASNIQGVTCTGGETCLQGVANAYLTTYIQSASDHARSEAISAIAAAGWTNRRLGATCTTILCAQAGFSFTLLGYMLLDQDRAQIIFEYYSNLISAMEAQRYFVSNIAFSIGPLILGLGIVARSFFFTRKLGGLLIALAAGIMFFLPSMYVFDQLTLDTTLTGGQTAQESGNPQCPAECQTPHAYAYADDGSPNGIKLGSEKDVYGVFPTDQNTAQGILNGTIPSASAPGTVSLVGGVPTLNTSGGGTTTIVSCTSFVSTDLCPMVCRELPFPNTLPSCFNQSTNNSDVLTTPEECAKLPQKCWVVRYATPPPPDPTILSTCPDSCKVTPPLNGSCSGACLASRPDCRVYSYDGNTFTWQPAPLKNAGQDQYDACNAAQQCTPSTSALSSCSYVVPATGSCDGLCTGCPQICRIITDNSSALPSVCSASQNTIDQCNSCPDGCKVDANHIRAVAADQCTSAAGTCPAEKRIITSDQLPNDYITGACDITTACPAENRTLIPRNMCDQCLFSVQSEMYNPPIQADCTSLCQPTTQVPAGDPTQFSQVGAEGLVGMQEIQDIAKLMLPGYVLPLFNILATLVFITGLSNILGGDVEIPGVSKVF